MMLSVFQDDFEVATLDQLRAHLRTRIEGKFGSFWLRHPSGSTMALMVHGDDAYIHYFPHQGHPGFQPEWKEGVGEEPVQFLADNRELTEMPRSFVISCPDAVAIFEEYFDTGAPSASIKWSEL